MNELQRMFQSKKEKLATAVSLSASLQRSATGATEDGDIWDVYTERQCLVRMQRRNDIDNLFTIPDVFLCKEDIDEVIVKWLLVNVCSSCDCKCCHGLIY